MYLSVAGGGGRHSCLASYLARRELADSRNRLQRQSYQIKNSNFHHALVEVCRPILDDLHRNNFLRLQVLTLHHLTKSSLSKNIEDEIPIPGKC
jgi:DNA-binding GntR family transcriptional regulator